MRSMFTWNLKLKAVAATAGILLLVLGFNTAVNIYSAAGKYREALISRATALAEGVKKDINKAVGFGLPLNALEGMGDKMRGLVEGDKDLSRAIIMDADGKALYASDPKLENSVLTDDASRNALGADGPLVHSYSDTAGEHFEKVIPLMSAEGKKIGVIRIALRAEVVDEQVRSLLLWSLMVGLISFVIATALVSIVVDRGISGPIRALSDTADRMASGDVSREVAIKGETEIAALGSAINAMSARLRDMLRRIAQTSASLADAMKIMSGSTQKMSQGARVQQEAAEQTAMTVNEMNASISGVAENSGAMSKAASDASSSATEMAASVEEVARNAGELASAVEETAASIEETLASIRQVSENTEALSSSAEQTSSAITEMSAAVREVELRAQDSAKLAEKVFAEASERGMAAAREAISGMDNIKQTVEATADVVNRLGKRSQEIGQILKVIDEVTDQTGLLALNAAILAAQAGEHGKGFAVVAEEIKDLAERTAASTKEISNLIVSVQEETAESVLAMARGLKAVEGGADLVRVTSDVFEQVADSSKQAVDMARAIEKTTAEQARGVAQITEASVSIADRIEQIAHAMQEQRKGSERIAKATERMRDLTLQVKTATAEQSAGSKQIAGAVESVRTQTGQVARSTAEQTQGARQIADAVSRIQKITEENVDVSIEMDMAVQALKEKAAALKTDLAKFTF